MRSVHVGGLLLLAVALCGAAGCRNHLVRMPPEPPPRTLSYNRMAVIEFFDESAYKAHGYSMELARALAGSLGRRTTSTDVFAVSRESLGCTENPFETGKMPLDVLVGGRSRHMAELAVVGYIDRIDPYRMPSVGVAVKVLDTGSGRVLFSLSDDWDAANRRIQHEIETYCRRYSESADCRYGPELFYNSPRYFLRFVADDLADRITEKL